ncbi:DHA2 family efflux MFS transporter permease subunit [Nocardioides bizhenqiangii]|uniref:DHA2 family efflux MFS transporter permease subunit n=1 Tax=Nocardioides bizhenqiangii TaxID=3095076 RepID=A0ABZ0ZSF7_9ACTN|nr:DHA2 family efflux MFS transporter permease subunit [Nocardioides sp. HM61]WQQ27251.1 DHA2 family efflux MFS transporter permease subunit [Nocardioides sp. HM61]
MTTTADTAAAVPTASERSGRRATIVALTVIAGTVMIPLDVTVVAIALARLSEETGASLPVIQWVSTGYTLALATVIPAAAWAMGRYGARGVFLGAIGVFTAGSLLVACSWDAGSLIAFRVVQGLGGGFVMPAAMTLALRAAPEGERGRVMSLLGLPILVGPVLGPPLGGWLLDNLSWRWMFLVNLPVGLLAIWLARRNLPKLPGDRSVGLDQRGLLLLAPAMALLVLGTSLADGSLVTVGVLLPVVAGLILLVGFARHSLRARHPLLKVRLLGNRLTGGGALVLVLFVGGYFSTLLLVPLYFQVARGESATTAGLLMVPQAVLAGLSIQVSGRLVDRVPALRVIGTGIALAAAGYGGFALMLGAETSYWVLVPFLMLGTTGAGATMLPTITMATRHLADADIPSGSTTINVLNQLSTSLVTAAVAVVLAAALASRLPALADGGIGDLQALPAAARLAAAPQVSDAVQVAMLLPVGLMLASLVVAVGVFRSAGR